MMKNLVSAQVRPKIYLAGPMAGLTITEANQWRYALEDAHSHLFQFINPCRNKEDLENQGVLTQFGYDESFMGQEHTVFMRDTHDVRTCDALLVNFLGADRISVGTIFEIGMAWTLRKPIVAVVEKYDNPYDHIFTRQAATASVTTLSEGVMVLRSLFNLLPVGATQPW